MGSLATQHFWPCRGGYETSCCCWLFYRLAGLRPFFLRFSLPWNDPRTASVQAAWSPGLKHSFIFRQMSWDMLLVGGLVAMNLAFSHILGISSSQLTFIFFRGLQTTNQDESWSCRGIFEEKKTLTLALLVLCCECGAFQQDQRFDVQYPCGSFFILADASQRSDPQRIYCGDLICFRYWGSTSTLG